jgi:thymidylate kinase
MMIVELIGAPGAGKTTLLPVVLGFFQAHDCRAYTVVEAARPFARRTVWGKIVLGLAPLAWQRPLLWRVFYYLSVVYRLKFVVWHWQLIQLVLAAQSRRPAAADVRQRQVLPWFFRQAGYYEVVQSLIQPDDVLVFDEGFIHRVVQLFTSSVENPGEEQIAAYVNLLPQPDLVVFIQASPDVCEKRIYARGLWQRAQHKDAAEIAQFVVHAHQAVDLAVAQARRRGWLVVEVDNSGNDLTAVKADLRRQLAQASLGNWQKQKRQVAVP